MSRISRSTISVLATAVSLMAVTSASAQAKGAAHKINRRH
jgi:hypothetical protein